MNDSRNNNSQRILLVDDQDDIITAQKLLLEREGFRVTCFSDPVAALKHFEEQSGAYDALITDITMPNITGIELAHETRKHSYIPIIFITGYTHSWIPQEISKITDSILLNKPVHTKVIIEKLRSFFTNSTQPTCCAA